MTEMTKHEPGMLCWADLVTEDLAKAKGFYGELFNWELRDQKTPEGIYSMALVRGKSVAGLAPLPPEMKTQGMRPHWNAYISVQDVAETARRVVPAGGKLLERPMDVMGEGRMAVLEDPTGATLCLWQPLKHAGAALMHEPGALCWAELMTRDPKTAGEFYSKVLGWNRKEQDMGGMAYTVFSVGEKDAVGMMAMPREIPATVPAHWTPYFTVSGCDATLTRAEKLRGRVLAPAMDVPAVGRFAALQDPQGASFSILQPSRA